MTHIKQIMPAPDNLFVCFEVYTPEKDLYEVLSKQVLAYGLAEMGLKVVPLILDEETGQLMQIRNEVKIAYIDYGCEIDCDCENCENENQRRNDKWNY